MNITEKLQKVRDINNDLNKVDESLRELAKLSNPSFNEICFSHSNSTSLGLELELPADVVARIIEDMKHLLEQKRHSLLQEANEMIK